MAVVVAAAAGALGGVWGQSAGGQAGAGDACQPQPCPEDHKVAFRVGGPGRSQVWLRDDDGTGHGHVVEFGSSAFPYACQALHWTIS